MTSTPTDDALVERLRMLLRENEREGYSGYTHIFVRVADAEAIVAALTRPSSAPHIPQGQ